jgi:hypothetical protein
MIVMFAGFWGGFAGLAKVDKGPGEVSTQQQFADVGGRGVAEDGMGGVQRRGGASVHSHRLSRSYQDGLAGNGRTMHASLGRIQCMQLTPHSRHCHHTGCKAVPEVPLLDIPCRAISSLAFAHPVHY